MERTPPKEGQPIRFSSQPDLSIQDPHGQDNIRNINLRKRKNPEKENILDIKDELMESFKQMMNTEMCELKQQNKQLLEYNSHIIQLLELNTTNYKEVMSRVQTLEDKCEADAKRINELEYQLNELQKRNLENTIEIRNIPREGIEDLNKIIKKVYVTLNIPHNDDTTNIYRRGKQNGPIIVEYQNSKKREEILKAVKKYNSENKGKPLNTEMLGISGLISRVYISEALTPISRKLLTAARELVKNGKYKYCWVSRGNVLLRKEEGHPAIIIKTLNQIKDLDMQ